jgi:DNA invertase Pin-like site-specific DNA recombinase
MNTDVDVDRIQSELDDLHKSKNDIERLIQRKKRLILKTLPSVHGFTDMDALISALAEFASGSFREHIGRALDSVHRGGRGKRYNAELRIAVRKALEAGDSQSEVARAQGISLATIARWKRTWEMPSAKRTRPRRSRVFATEHSESASKDKSADTMPSL